MTANNERNNKDINCPKCKKTYGQQKDGFTSAGSQRYRCYYCNARYTPNPKKIGYNKDIRMMAVRMYKTGMSYRKIGNHFQVDHVTVMNWVKKAKSRRSLAQSKRIYILRNG